MVDDNTDHPAAAQADLSTLDQRALASEFIIAVHALVTRTEDDGARQLHEADLEVMQRELEREEPRISLLRTVAVDLRADVVAAHGSPSVALLALPWP